MPGLVIAAEPVERLCSLPGYGRKPATLAERVERGNALETDLGRTRGIAGLELDLSLLHRVPGFEERLSELAGPLARNPYCTTRGLEVAAIRLELAAKRRVEGCRRRVGVEERDPFLDRERPVRVGRWLPPLGDVGGDVVAAPLPMLGGALEGVRASPPAKGGELDFRREEPSIGEARVVATLGEDADGLVHQRSLCGLVIRLG